MVHSVALPTAMDEKAGWARNILPAGVFFALVLFMWGPFNPTSGMPYESTFSYSSDTSSVWKGFFFRGDPLRIHTNTFYHLAYLLAEVLGIGGSFVPFQVVYALLWWARGFLIFLILRKFLPDQTPFCYLVGALVIAHASDASLNWVGQLNQFGYLFWMFLAFYMLIHSFLALQLSRCLIFLALALFFEHMSLWSYESQLPIMLVLPLLLLILKQGLSKRFMALALPWYSVIFIYMYLTISRYFKSSGQTYQESVLRQDWNVLTVLSDWWFNITSSIEFWTWNKRDDANLVYLWAVLAAMVFVVAGAILIYPDNDAKKEQTDPRFPKRRTCWKMLGAGFLFLALAFPVYLLLNSARSLWRTQLLSGLGAALTLSSGIILVVQFLPRARMKSFAYLALGAIIVFCGVRSGINSGAAHFEIWERHRRAIAQVLEIAPQVKPSTVIVMANIPKEDDPFGHNMWFDVALRLAYPKIQVAGVYFYSDGILAPGANLKIDGDYWKWDTTGFAPLVRKASLEHTIVIEYSADKIPILSSQLPSFLQVNESSASRYNPRKVIEEGPPAPRALRRYVDSSGARLPPLNQHTQENLGSKAAIQDLQEQNP